LFNEPICINFRLVAQLNLFDIAIKGRKWPAGICLRCLIHRSAQQRTAQMNQLIPDELLSIWWCERKERAALE
jgi:hypothetical protein